MEEEAEEKWEEGKREERKEREIKREETEHGLIRKGEMMMMLFPWIEFFFLSCTEDSCDELNQRWKRMLRIVCNNYDNGGQSYLFVTEFSFCFFFTVFVDAKRYGLVSVQWRGNE